VRAVTEAILDATDFLLEKDDGSEHTDPHVWMDVSGWLRAVPVVAETLSEFDPEHAADYRANAATYMNKLQALDIYTKTAMATIPEGRRILVTAHDAFQYFGRAYGIEEWVIPAFLSILPEAKSKHLIDALYADSDRGKIFSHDTLGQPPNRSIGKHNIAGAGDPGAVARATEFVREHLRVPAGPPAP